MYIIFKWFALDCYNVLWIAEFTINFLHICEEPIIAKRPVFFTIITYEGNPSGCAAGYSSNTFRAAISRSLWLLRRFCFA